MNQRQINFRAYKISTKEILPINSLESMCINSARLTDQEFKDLVIMQGTGLFYKDGTEIFEGDFAKNEIGEKGSIMYLRGEFGFSCFNEPAYDHLVTFCIHDTNNTTLEKIGIRSFNSYRND